MSFEDDMIESGFNNEQDYLDYLHNKAENEWDKQLERDKKADEWEKYLDSLTDEDIYELKREKQEKVERLSEKKLIQEQQENQLKIWKESSPEEKIIWESTWGCMSYLESRFMNSSYKSEYDEWKKWLEDRHTFKKWKNNNIAEWKKLWDLREKDIVVNWVNVDIESGSYFDDEIIYSLWNDFSLWKETHLEEWLSHQENCTITLTNDNIYDLYAWNQISKLHRNNNSDVIFEIWRTDNMDEWEVWKCAEKLDFLRNKSWRGGKFKNIIDYHYRYFKTWKEDNSEIWEKWKAEKINLLQIWEKEFLFFWQELIEKGPEELYQKGCQDSSRDSIWIDEHSTEEALEWGVSIEAFWTNFLDKNNNILSSWTERSEEMRKTHRYQRDKRRGKLEKIDLDIERRIKSINIAIENDTLQLWKNFTTETEILNLISNLCDKKLGLLWIKENKLEYEKWQNFSLWEEKKQSIEAYKKWIDNLKNKGDFDITLFELWKEKNKENWIIWKKDNFHELKSKINDLITWKIWAEKNHYKWKLWADEKLDNWKSWFDDRWNFELHCSWNEDHFGNTEDYNEWVQRMKEENTWSIWENELIDRFYKRNYFK